MKIFVIFLIILLALILGFIAPSLFNQIVKMGYRIPQESLVLDYLYAVTYGLALLLFISYWKVSPKDKKALLIIWTIKMVVVLGVMLFYEKIYPLDAYGYYEGGKVGIWDWTSGKFPRGTPLVTEISHLHHILLPASFHSLKLSFAMIGLVGIYIYYRAVVIFLGYENVKLFYIFALFPSILFWSSIIGKEPIMLLTISLFAYGVVGFWRLKSYRYCIWIGVGLISTYFVRSWMALILGVSLLAFIGRE